LTNRFTASSSTAWGRWLDEQGFVGLDYLLIEGQRAGAYSADVCELDAALPVGAAAGTWVKRLDRLFLVGPTDQTSAA